MKMGLIAAAAAALFVAGCASGSGDSRQAGTFLNPWCAPDGSVVYTQYSNSKGEFEGVKASPDYCPWNQK